MRSVGIKLYGFKKKKSHYAHHKRLNSFKQKRKKSFHEVGSDLICGDPNVYLKDAYEMSDKSEDVSFGDIEK